MRHEFWQFTHQSKYTLPQSDAACHSGSSLDERHLGTPLGKPLVRRTQLEPSSDPGEVQTSTWLFLNT